MKVAFITAQSLTGSTNIGRILPLARHLSEYHQVDILVHNGQGDKPNPKIKIHFTGRDPFTLTESGKQRLHGLALIMLMLVNVMKSSFKLVSLRPQVIVISKSLPETVLAAWLASKFIRPAKIILDIDDFELTANVVASLKERPVKCIFIFGFGLSPWPLWTRMST